MSYHAEIVIHPADPECPGHDINMILRDESQAAGYCLCIHPMMTMISFAGTTCDWCGQPFTDQAYTPAAKDLRTKAVRAALGDGTGRCTAL